MLNWMSHANSTLLVDKYIVLRTVTSYEKSYANKSQTLGKATAEATAIIRVKIIVSRQSVSLIKFSE